MNRQQNSQLSIRYSLGYATKAVLKEMNRWQTEDRVRRLWQRDSSLWTNADEHQWMGWLSASLSVLNTLPILEGLSREILNCGCTDLALLGMGGSSLCPDLFSRTFGKIGNYPCLKVLDSTDPAQIRHFEENIDLEHTYFIVSSKSGTTLEPLILKQYFYVRLKNILGTVDVGERFLAITDPGSELEYMANIEHFKAIFYGEPSIGGRLSALSNFGIVPLGLMGVDVRQFLHHVSEMEQACSLNLSPKKNPGVALGIILGVCAKEGKDKVTLIISSAIHALGAWITQLIAESTGKNGKGLIPIDQETLGNETVYGDDRVFVYLRLETFPDIEHDIAVKRLAKRGYAIIQLNLSDQMHLGAELFRWQIATAVASSIIGVHPFNQPDVEEAKVRTKELVDGFEGVQMTIKPNLIYAEDRIQLLTDDQNSSAIHQLLQGKPCLASYLDAHLNRLHPGDYVDLCAFIEMKDEYLALLQQIRMLIRNQKRVATSVEFGPRFLHSTGQIHKGGPNTGLFLQITAEKAFDFPIPDHGYTFGLVLEMQAHADFEVLTQRARRFLRIHLHQDINTGLQQLYQCMQAALLSQ